MSLKFKCTKCGDDIIVHFLKTGEEAQCKNCQMINTIPKDAIVTDELPQKMGHNTDLTMENSRTPKTSKEFEPGEFGYSLANTLWRFMLIVIVLWGVIGSIITIIEGNSGVSTFTLPIKIETNDYSDMYQNDYNSKNPLETFRIIGYTESKVAIKNSILEYLDIFTHTFYAAIFLWIAYHLRCLFNSVKLGRPFTKDNTKKIRIIGYSIIISELLRWLWFFSITCVCNSHLDIEICGACHGVFDNRPFFEFLRSDLRIEWIFVGMVVVAIAEIIGMGVKMQQESELTI